MSEDASAGKMGFQATWAMAVGGMVGGGIFSTLGVVISLAGSWAWLSFVLAGVIALLAGYAYVHLSMKFERGGGAFVFLRAEGMNRFAGSLSWILIVGYVLTNAVYAFTFGQYLGHVVGLGAWFPRVAAVVVVGLFVGLNLVGVGEAAGVEIVMVWFKLLVLLGLAGFGLAQWNPEILQTSGASASAGPPAALFGAATVFMAYEGFQLLSYDYDDIREPKKVLPRAIVSSIVLVIAIYVVVTLGVPMLIGADEVVAHDEVALSIAGKEALGTTGLVVVTIAAAFSTGSAINSTLFATARLSHEVAKDGELPAFLGHTNGKGVPDRSVIGLGAFAAVLAAIGSLGALVEAASLAFLLTFAVVCGIAFYERAGHRWLTGLGALGAVAALGALAWRLAQESWLALATIGTFVVVVAVGRPFLLRHVRTEEGS